MFVTINGKRWELLRPQNYGPLAQCDPPTAKDKKIKIDARLEDERELECIIHELLHASAWDVLDEDFVDQTGRDIARVLWRLGYRLED